MPSFPSSIAFDTIRRELEISNLDEVYSSISDQPVAAASLGQVYKATLKTTGDTVAVKVQRPGVLETVSLDLYLFRTFGTLLASLPNGISSRLDIVGLLDEFAFRFYQELDYVNECKNGEIIREQMKVLPKVLIPKNYPTFTSRKVHTAGELSERAYDFEFDLELELELRVTLNNPLHTSNTAFFVRCRCVCRVGRRRKALPEQRGRRWGVGEPRGDHLSYAASRIRFLPCRPSPGQHAAEPRRPSLHT